MTARPDRPIVGLLLFFVASACGSAAAPSMSAFPPPPAGQGFQLSVETIAPPASEIYKCFVYPIPLRDVAFVNRIEYDETPGLHHMTVSTPTLNGKKFPYGTYDCASLGNLMEDVTMMFGAQGDGHGVIQLPEGVAATVPSNLDIVHEVHYVNATRNPVHVVSRVNAYSIPEASVTKGIWGSQVRDEHIEIPPQSMHTQWTRCIMNEDVDVLFLASHTHQLGVDFQVAPFDGTNVGDMLFENKDWHSPKITQFTPPLSVRAGTGFEYRCTWYNPTDQTVEYGLSADDEMCNLTMVHTPFSQTARCEVVASSTGYLWKPGN
jgi:hypothetical protein